MSHPNPSHDKGNEYPSDGFRSGTGGLSKGTRKTLAISEKTGTHSHSHNKGGLLGALKGLQNATHFGEAKGARAKTKALSKKKGEDIF